MSTVIDIHTTCDEDIWLPIRPGGPTYNIIVRHVCDPWRRQEILTKWQKGNKIEKRWGPMCPNLCLIETNEVEIS